MNTALEVCLNLFVPLTSAIIIIIFIVFYTSMVFSIELSLIYSSPLKNKVNECSKHVAHYSASSLPSPVCSRVTKDEERTCVLWEGRSWQVTLQKRAHSDTSTGNTLTRVCTNGHHIFTICLFICIVQKHFWFP